MAWGSKKADIVREAISGPITDQVSASFLQQHPDATFYLDKEAASALS
jgi:glucosamine-6-phosphate deaminase